MEPVIPLPVAQARAAVEAAQSTIASLKQKLDDLQRVKADAVVSRAVFEDAAVAALIGTGDEPPPAAPAAPPPMLGAAIDRLNVQLREAVEYADTCKGRLRSALADCAIARRDADVIAYRAALERLRQSLAEVWAGDMVCSRVALTSAISPNSLTTFSLRDCTRGGDQFFTVDSLRRDASERADALRAEIAAECGCDGGVLPF